MKNCDFKHVMKQFIVCFVLSQFGSAETAALADCPPQQVLHFNPETNEGICCIPVSLPKGFGFKSCTRNGTNDTIEVCPMKPLQLYQWDDTTTESEATCAAEMQCLDVENKIIEKCEDHGQNCRKECVCNFPGGYCGTEYFNCIPFPVGCPRNNVQKDCSCRSPGLEPEKKSGESDPDLPNPITSITSVSKLPLSPASGNSDKKIEGDQTADVGIMNEKDNNNNDTKSETKPEESLSIGSIIGLTSVVIVVIGGLIFVYILWKDRYKRLWGKCKRENQDSDKELSPGLEPEKKSGESDPDLPNPITSITSVSKLPLSPASGNSDKKIEGDQTADVGIMNEKDNNNNDTKSETKPEESLSIGSIIGLTSVVIVVIGGLIFVYILWKDRYKRLWGKCKRENQDSAEPRPIQKVAPFRQNSSEDQNEEAQSLQRQVTVPDEPAEQELMTQPFLSEDKDKTFHSALPQEANGAQTNLLEVPQMNLSVHFPTLGSSLFDSRNTNSTADQQEVSYGSGRDQTHVKVVNTSENLTEAEGHDSGALEILQMNLSVHFPTLGSSLFDSRNTNSTADQQEVSCGSGRDQTQVKVVNTSENLIEEERHDSGALEIPQMNLSVHFPTLGSSLNDSHNSTADQQEVSCGSGRDQTHVKVVNTSENLIEEERHDSGVLEYSRLCHVRVEPSLASERDGEEEKQLL